MICTEFDPDCYGCQLRQKDVGLSAAAIPSRQNDVRPATPADPSWEKGRAGERRRDGSFMPYLNHAGSPMGIKEYSERRREIDGQVRAVRSGEHPTVQPKGTP
jgi:hypothetical protein